MPVDREQLAAEQGPVAGRNGQQVQATAEPLRVQ